MTGMEHAIEQAAQVMWRCDNPDLHPAWVERSWGDAGESGERAEYELRARALAEDGWLAPAPLTEIRAENQFGETHRRWATDWEPVDRAEGDGRADQ